MVKTLLAVPEINLELEDSKGKTALEWARDKELFLIEKLIMERLNASKGEVSKTELMEIKIRELMKTLQVSEETNLELRNTVEELNQRIKLQDQTIKTLRAIDS